ncbi:MAG TPA: CoA transferase, partial [Polyangiales bacterium]|nr:CoA transferase [Polyangiales bacterium]
ADGYVFHSLMSGQFGAPANRALSQWMDDCAHDCGYEHDNPLREVDWSRYDRSNLPADVRARWEAAIARFFRAQTKATIAGEGRRRGINASVVQEPADILSDPQLRARGFLRETELHDGQRGAVPDYFVQTDRGECQLPAASPAPADPSFATPRVPAQSTAGAPARSDALPLAGVRILDLSWALVGSLTTKALADHGALVVKVESATRPCLTRTDVQVARSTRESFDDKPWFAHLNTSKLGLQLNIKHPRAREVLDPLLGWADVVVENFSPGTLAKLGLDYAALRQRWPQLILVSGSAYGQTGPLAREWGVDGTGAALSGRLFLTGWPDRAPVVPASVPYGDVILPQLMVAACAAALADRRRGAGGRQIDAAMYEACAQQMSAALVAAQLGAPLIRSGNRERGVLVQGVYPTRGEDRWIAISIFDAGDWERSCACMGGVWPSAAELVAADGALLDALDERIAAFTRGHEERALMHTLQAHGIAAGVVQDPEDLLEHDPQLKTRGAFATLEHPVLGSFAHQAAPHHLARTPARVRTAPLLGQHTEHVCRELAGLDPQLFAELQREGVFV